SGPEVGVRLGLESAGAAAAMLHGLLRVAAEYSLQSGLASVQLGMLRQFGYQIPERFRYPLMAQDPLDFWRRWNMYVGSWIRRYVFLPMALRLRRGTHLPAGLAKAAAFLAAFVVIGFLHDAFVYTSSFQPSLRGAYWFVGAGLSVIAWRIV